MTQEHDPTHERWTDRLSEYLDGGLPAAEHAEVARHLETCADCAAVLEDLRAVVARAAELRQQEAGPPARDLWPAVAARLGPVDAEDAVPVAAEGTGRVKADGPAWIEAEGPAWIEAEGPAWIEAEGAARVAEEGAARVEADGAARIGAPRRTRRLLRFSVPQLAAASLALALVSGTTVWLALSLGPAAPTLPSPAAGVGSAPGVQTAALPVAAFDETDAAIAELEGALAEGRSRLDPSTVEVIEANLAVIDAAIEEARRALAADPASTYLNLHLADTMRRKLQLLRDAGTLAAHTL